MKYNDIASFSASSVLIKFTSWAFCLWTEPCAPGNSLIFSALAVQITISKYKEIPGHFYPVL